MDTKKVYLDKFVQDHSRQPRTKLPDFFEPAMANVARMDKVFTEKDPLLQQVGMVMLYYHVFRLAHNEGWDQEITRKRLADSDRARAKNRTQAEKDITKANYNLIEFDRYSQSPNDAYATKFRLKTLLQEAFAKKVSTDDL